MCVHACARQMWKTIVLMTMSLCNYSLQTITQRIKGISFQTFERQEPAFAQHCSLNNYFHHLWNVFRPNVLAPNNTSILLQKQDLSMWKERTASSASQCSMSSAWGIQHSHVSANSGWQLSHVETCSHQLLRCSLTAGALQPRLKSSLCGKGWVVWDLRNKTL